MGLYSLRNRFICVTGSWTLAFRYRRTVSPPQRQLGFINLEFLFGMFYLLSVFNTLLVMTFNLVHSFHSLF